jgi:hypothetical protein
MDYIKKVINEIQCLITDTVMTEQEGSRRCITTEDLNGFELWCQWLEKASDGECSDENSGLNIPVVSISLPSDEEIREPIQNAIYATGSYTTDQCTEFADGILTYLNEAGYKVVRQ